MSGIKKEESSRKIKDLLRIQAMSSRDFLGGFEEPLVGKIIVIHGATASGKTCLALSLATEKVKDNRNVLLLMPEGIPTNVLSMEFSLVVKKSTGQTLVSMDCDQDKVESHVNGLPNGSVVIVDGPDLIVSKKQTGITELSLFLLKITKICSIKNHELFILVKTRRSLVASNGPSLPISNSLIYKASYVFKVSSENDARTGKLIIVLHSEKARIAIKNKETRIPVVL